MRTGISFTVSIDDRSRLEAVISHRSSPQKHVWRCRIVLLSADGFLHHRDHGRHGQVQDLRLALAGEVHGGGH